MKVLAYVLIAVASFGQVCAGCVLSLKADPLDFQPGYAIEVDWGDATPGTCDAAKCESAGCDFNGATVTVTVPVESWTIDGDWHLCPKGETVWKYADEPVACAGGHRVRIYPKADQSGATLGLATLACTACEPNTNT